MVMSAHLKYMGLEANQPITLDSSWQPGFIGSCTIRASSTAPPPAGRGGKRAAQVSPAFKQAIGGPRVGLVKEQAELEGLDQIIHRCSFEWLDPGWLHVPGERNPGPLRIRRALALPHQPQLLKAVRVRRGAPSASARPCAAADDCRHFVDCS